MVDMVRDSTIGNSFVAVRNSIQPHFYQAYERWGLQMRFRSVNVDCVGGKTLLYILEEVITGRKATNQENSLKEVINRTSTPILCGYTRPDVRAHESKCLLINNANDIIKGRLEKFGYIRARIKAYEHNMSTI